jgi:lactoylglutathione lyase
MQVAYVVLYVTDLDECIQFWTEKVGMVEKSRKQAGEIAIVQVGFESQAFALELVPLALMQNNPNGLDLATPSMAFRVDDLADMRDALMASGVAVSPVADHGGIESFAFADNESRWFAVLSS